MNPIDKFLKEYSYRFEKGYFDVENENDWVLLEEILYEMDIDTKLISPLAQEAINIIKEKYGFDDSNFKIQSAVTFKILLPSKFPKSRKEIIDELKEISNFKFEEASIGVGSSLGRLKYKDKITIYIKFLEKQGDKSSGKANEQGFINLINNHIQENQSITVIFKSDKKHLEFEQITKCVDSSKSDASTFAKSDAQLLSGETVKCNISLKKRNAIRWESSKTRFKNEYNNFINKAKNNELGNVGLKPVEGSNNKFKLYDNKADKILSKVVVKNVPDSIEDNVIFGKEEPKPFVIKEDFEGFKDYTFENNILTINCYKIYTDIEDIKGTYDELVFAFSNHIAHSYGVEFRGFSKGLLYNDNTLKGSSVEIDFKNIS